GQFNKLLLSVAPSDTPGRVWQGSSKRQAGELSRRRIGRHSEEDDQAGVSCFLGRRQGRQELVHLIEDHERERGALEGVVRCPRKAVTYRVAGQRNVVLGQVELLEVDRQQELLEPCWEQQRSRFPVLDPILNQGRLFRPHLRLFPHQPFDSGIQK